MMSTLPAYESPSEADPMDNENIRLSPDPNEIESNNNTSPSLDNQVGLVLVADEVHTETPAMIHYHTPPQPDGFSAPVDPKSSRRFAGLDLGNTCSRLFYTYQDHSERKYSRPCPLQFEGNPSLLSLVIFKPGGGDTYVRRNDVLSQSGSIGSLTPFEANFKYRLEVGDPRASRAVQVLAARFLDEYKHSLGESLVDFKENHFSLGIPPEWENQPDILHHLLDAFQQAGFGRIELVPDAIAAVFYHVFCGDLQLTHDDQNWLVVDVGGTFTRISRVHKSGLDGGLSVAATQRLGWGGDQIDDVLYERILLQRYWHKPAPPTDAQKSVLLLLVRDTKEQLAGSNNEPKSAHRTIPMDGISERLEFNQPLFESSDVCQPLIYRLQNLLLSSSVQQNPDFQNVDGVILIGGSTNWDFVQNQVRIAWSNYKVVMSNDPQLTVASGLALVYTDFNPPATIENSQNLGVIELTDTSSPSGSDPIPPEGTQPGYPPEPATSIEAKLIQIHKNARSFIINCIIAGAVVALLLAWIPCGSWPLLLILEFYMVYKLTRFYNYNVTDSIFAILALALLIISFVLSFVIGIIVELLPIINWALKPLIAALVVWGLGEAAIKVLDQQSAKDGFINVAKANL